MTPVARLLFHVGAFAAVCEPSAVAFATAVWASLHIGGTAAARFAGWRCGRTSAGIPATLAATMPVASKRPLNNLTNILNSLS